MMMCVCVCVCVCVCTADSQSSENDLCSYEATRIKYEEKMWRLRQDSNPRPPWLQNNTSSEHCTGMGYGRGHGLESCWSIRIFFWAFFAATLLLHNCEDSSFIFGWMKWSVMKEMINGFSNSQARWESVLSVVILEMWEVCKCKDASI